MTETMQVKMKGDVELISREVPCQRIVEIELVAPQSTGAHPRPPLNLGLVLDRSGSMDGQKIAEAKTTLRRIVEQMANDDVVSVVAFDDTIRTLASGLKLNNRNRSELLEKIDHIRTGGSTNLTDGWLTGCNCVAEGPSGNYIRRALLVSDGLANVGITDHDEIFQHAAAIFERGITTSTFGVGEGFDEHLLEGMANRGGGNFAFIDYPSMIDQMILAEFKDLLTVTARNVKVEITLPTGVSAELPGEWSMKQTAHKITVSLSDLPAGRSTTLFLKLLTPPGDGQLVLNTVVTYENDSDQKCTAVGELTFQYASEGKVLKAAKNQDLLTRYSAVETGVRMNEALKLERAGKRLEAKQMMRRTLDEYGQDLPAPTRARYTELSSRIENGLGESDRKNTNYDAYLLKKHRHEDEH